jgi:hypothetical protein
MDRFQPDPPEQRPPPYAQVDWPKMHKHLSQVYGYRSKALHSGTPFPDPMCSAPLKDTDSCPEERPSYISAGAAGAVWQAKDLPRCSGRSRGPPVIVVICDNDSIRHARKVTAYLKEHPRLELLYGAPYSPAGNHASDQHYGPIDRVHVYPYRLSQDRIEAVPRIRVNRDAAQAGCLEINAAAPERSYHVAATDGNGKRDRAEGRARCYNCSGAWGIC